jgi:hypothetical protein
MKHFFGSAEVFVTNTLFLETESFATNLVLTQIWMEKLTFGAVLADAD